MKLIHEIISESSKKYGSHIALSDDYSGYTTTYKQMEQDIIYASAALQSLGIEKGMHLAQFSENSSKWMILDQAILRCGAVNAVRGSLAPINELEYIYEQSDSIALITDSKSVINQFKDFLSNKETKFIIYTGNEKIEQVESFNTRILTFEQIIELGKTKEFNKVDIDAEDLATLIYSSGTTGKPKGIMLSHKNLASQLVAIPSVLNLKETKTVTVVLPIWHAYERTCEYYLLSIGTKNCYTNVKHFKKDLQKHRPHYLIAVPRIWEAIYEGVFTEIKKKPAAFRSIVNFFLSSSLKRDLEKRIVDNTCIYNQNASVLKKIKCQITSSALTPVHNLGQKLIYQKFYQAIGGRFIKGISGGGALAAHIDDFFSSVGIKVYVGYGLTETAPVLAVRREDDNKPYSTGPALPNTEFLIVDAETYHPLPKGQKGIVLAKGPQVMKGYYKEPESSKKVLLSNGYFVTGDIGWLTEDNCLVLTGRAKDIIVLSNGENIEPEAIEQSCMSSPFVKQIVLAGQDKNALSALIVPDVDALKEFAAKRKINVSNPLACNDLKNEVLKELREKIQERKTFRSHERLANIDFVPEAFTPENGLMTMTAKIKKNEVYERYRHQIEAMYN